MIMTIQNPVDWASLFWSDSEEFDNINIPQDTEILLKAYKKEITIHKLDIHETFRKSYISDKNLCSSFEKVAFVYETVMRNNK